jgi:hypothetical protein
MSTGSRFQKKENRQAGSILSMTILLWSPSRLVANAVASRLSHGLHLQPSFMVAHFLDFYSRNIEPGYFALLFGPCCWGADLLLFVSLFPILKRKKKKVEENRVLLCFDSYRTSKVNTQC